jgi:plastocyanin
LLAIAISLAACSKKSNPTSPGGGGGGGSLELNSGNIGAGGIYQHTFATSGTYTYHCIYHGVMTGTVVVDAGAPSGTANVSITSSSAPFAAATVQPGGTVTWTNNTGITHTVTSD